MRKRIGVCAALALCVSIAASVPAFAAKDDAVMVEALNNESAEVNGIVPELHVEDAEASNSNGQGVVESAVVGDMKPRPVRNY